MRQAIEILNDFCEQDSIHRRHYSHIVKAIEKMDFSKLSQGDWFLIWDSIGCSEFESRDEFTHGLHLMAGSMSKIIGWRMMMPISVSIEDLYEAWEATKDDFRKRNLYWPGPNADIKDLWDNLLKISGERYVIISFR